jgi:hypothetical protein
MLEQLRRFTAQLENSSNLNQYFCKNNPPLLIKKFSGAHSFQDQLICVKLDGETFFEDKLIDILDAAFGSDTAIQHQVYFEDTCKPMTCFFLAIPNSMDIRECCRQLSKASDKFGIEISLK